MLFQIQKIINFPPILSSLLGAILYVLMCFLIVGYIAHAYLAAIGLPKADFSARLPSTPA
jgi:hypothetical protein